MTDDEIVAVKHQVLSEWLDAKPSSDDRESMKESIRRLLLAAHAIGICHRDVHTGNIVVRDDGMPLLIDPAYATESVNEHCYDLEGPEASFVPVPDDHLRQGDDHTGGVWWGSTVKFRSLENAFGPHA